MSRKPRAAIDARLIALAGEGRHSERHITAVLKREGHDVTASGVHRALVRLGLAANGKPTVAKTKGPQKASSRDGGTKVSAPTAPASEPVDLDSGDLAARVRRTIANLESASEQAKTDGNGVGIVQSGRAITQALALLARLTPTPAPNVDEHPDMLAAAKRGREAMHAFFDRLREATS